jgi:hypothetical protein
MPDDSLRKLVKNYGLNRFVNLQFPRESWLVRFILKQTVKNRIQGSVTFADNMHKTIPKLVFILIPFFALLLKLMYFRRKIPYFNHIIFSLHFLSFVFLMFWINKFGSMITGWTDLVLLIILSGYLFFALFNIYRQKIFATIGKCLILFFGILITLAFFYIIAASISFMMI